MKESNPIIQDQQEITTIPVLNPVVSSAEDIVGHIALSNLLLASKNQSFKELIASLDIDVINIYRNSALRDLSKFTEREISRRIEDIKSEVVARTHHEVMRENFTFLLKDQQANFDNVVLEINNSGSAFRQIVIAVISAFAFGLIISAAALLANPFADVIRAWHSH